MWGDLLWDKQELIERHTDQNIEFVGKCRTFVGHIAQAEIEFAKRLRAIVKESSSADDDTTSTCGKVWQSVLQSVNKVAEQHEGTSTALLAQVCTPMKQIMKTKAQERQDVLKQIAKLREAQAKAIANLEKSRKKYEKHEKDAETARIHFEKLEKLESTTKKKEQEARLKWAAKAKEAEAVLRTLEDEADGVNRGRVVFYKQDLPAAYNSLQAIDESRAENLVSNLSEFAKCYKNAMTANIQAMETVQQTAQGHKKASRRGTLVEISTLQGNGASHGLIVTLTFTKDPCVYIIVVSVSVCVVSLFCVCVCVRVMFKRACVEVCVCGSALAFLTCAARFGVLVFVRVKA
eukprot:m.171109 g.171109  ORF g.171109 m.171109 type:complete len:348 (-) comp17834_c0_seq3:693-1736(-)